MYPKACVSTVCFLVLLICFTGCGGSKNTKALPNTAVEQPIETWNIAVFPFEVEGKSKLSGNTAADLVISELVGLEGYRVVEQEQFSKAISQLGIAASDLADPSNQTKLGNLLGARLQCFGRINKAIGIITARVILTETREQLFIVKTENKDEVKGIKEISGLIREKLKSQSFVAQLNKYSEKPAVAISPPEKVTVKGYGAIIDGDIITAKELALKDAYSKAIEEVCGVKLLRQTQVENFQLVRDKILTESVGYVTSYEIVNENPKSEIGYEVTVNASVSRQPLSDPEKMSLMVKYLFANPRIAIVVDGDEKRAAIVEGQIADRLGKAGFTVIDMATVQEKKKELADSKSDEDAARLASALKADVIIRGNILTEITTNIKKIEGVELSIAPLAATTTGTFRIITAETADVISVFSHESLSKEQKVGYGSTEAAAMGKSVDNFAQASGDKLVWEIASALGGATKLTITLKNVTMKQTTDFLQQLQEMPKSIIINADMSRYDKNIAEYQVESAVKTQVFQKKMLESIKPEKLDAKELTIDKMDFGTITASLKF